MPSATMPSERRKRPNAKQLATAAAATHWALVEQGIFHAGLAVSAGPHGLQVTTSTPIGINEPLVSVPSSLLITSMRAIDAARQLGRSTTSVEIQDEEAHVAMAVWLLNATSSSTPPPSHGGWLAALPDSLDCTIEWSEAELAHLQASTARTRARQLRRWVDVEHARLFPAASTWHPSNAQFRWALCAVWSRSFHLEGGSWRVLAPGADFFDHAVAPAEVAAKLELVEDRNADSTSCTSPAGCGHTANAADATDDAATADVADTVAEASGAGSGSGDGDDGYSGSMGESISIVFRSTRALAAGEAVEIDYGGRPNAQLVTTHGFAIKDNPHESIPLSLAPSESDPLGAVSHAHSHTHPRARAYARAHAHPLAPTFTIRSTPIASRMHR